jgi:hypothetical protein
MKKIFKIFAYLILIIFSIFGIIFFILTTYEFIRHKKGENPVSLSYNFENSTFMIIEHNISEKNTIEEMPSVSFFEKMNAIVYKIIIYLLPFSLGAIFVYFIFFHNYKKESKK